MSNEKRSKLTNTLIIIVFISKCFFCCQANAVPVNRFILPVNPKIIEDDNQNGRHVLSDKFSMDTRTTKEQLEQLFGKHMPGRDVLESFQPLINQLPAVDTQLFINKYYEASSWRVSTDLQEIRAEHMRAMDSFAHYHKMSIDIKSLDVNWDSFISDDQKEEAKRFILINFNRLFASMIKYFLYDISNDSYNSYDSIITIRPPGEICIFHKMVNKQEERELLNHFKSQYRIAINKAKDLQLHEIAPSLYISIYGFFKSHSIKIIMNEPGYNRKDKALFFLSMIGIYGDMQYMKYHQGGIVEQHRELIESVNKIK